MLQIQANTSIDTLLFFDIISFALAKLSHTHHRAIMNFEELHADILSLYNI
jgi:hypothetical protein